MAESSAQERTEEPTARRLSKAREEGQVARSTEAPAAAVVIGALLVLMLAGSWMINRLASHFASGFTFDRKSLDTPSLMLGAFGHQLFNGFLVVLPVMGITLVMAIVASGLSGGFLFAPAAAAPKASKLSLIAGFKRMFGAHALVELGKAFLKCMLVGSALWFSLSLRMHDILRIGEMALEPALALAGTLLLQSALTVAMALALIALFDVPWQRHTFKKRMRMTRQEIKDEMKDMEGRPEIKAQIRRRQREMSNARMLKRVKDADVVITNPEHFAVALEYDPTSNGAPVLVAKGSDFMAAKIREEAANAGVHLFAAPELARALYFTTEAEQPVPEVLYHAVAQVIAYVFNLEGAQPGRPGMRRPHPVVPPAMRFDADGRRLEPEEAAPAPA
ncbi:MAG: Flagellar biosynthetic protein FlhB [Pseudomonadota bacterium]